MASGLGMHTYMDTKGAIAYLNSLGLHRVKPGLERIENLLKLLGNPEKKTPCIIIAGTNGKGSVAVSIASVMQAEGYRTGLYTSPHLVRISERIRINGEEIPPDDLFGSIMEIKGISSHLPEEPSYFEVLTASAFLYFARKRTDFSVLEVGMGGRWDATNVVTPLTSVITNVSKDHTEFLGETIREIASEKAGVIKRGVPVVTGAKGEALEVIEAVATRESAHISVMGRDFEVRGESTEDFSYLGSLWNLDHLRFNLPGLYQLENASLAIAAIESICRFHGIRVEEKSLRKGLSETTWEGRLEIIRGNPPLVLDGAHNPGAACALRKSLESLFPATRFVFLIGMLSDKDHGEYIGEISPIAEEIVLTNVPSERGMRAEALADIARRFTKRLKIIPNLEEAFNEVKGLSVPACVTGSLYLIGAIKSL